MTERIEFHGDTSRSEIVPGVGHSKESRPQEANRKFALELEKRLSQQKDKDKSEEEEDKIIIHQDNDQKEDDSENENNNNKDNRSDQPPDPDDPRGHKINLLA